MSSRIFGFLLLLCSSMALAGKAYKWLDAEGHIHYSEQPPTSQASTVIEMPTEEKPTPINNPPSQPTTDNKSSSTEESILVEKHSPEEIAKIRKENCDKSQQALTSLTTYARIKMKDKDDNYRILSEEERQAEIKKYQGYVKENCIPQTTNKK